MKDDMVRVRLDQLQQLEGVAELATSINEHVGAEGCAAIDLSGLSTGDLSRDRRLRLPSLPLLVLANLMLSQWASVPLHVRLPVSESLLLPLERGGLLFAMANHPRVTDGSWATLPRGTREEWSRDWQAGNQQLRMELFNAAEHSTEDLWWQDDGRDVRRVTFRNIHRPSRRSVASELYPTHVRPWLRRAVGNVVPAEARDQYEGLIRDVGQILGQLVDNVRIHAQLSRSGSSFVQIAVTRGRVTRVHVTVFDTGPGIPVTIAENHPVSGSQAASSLVHAALVGELPRYSRDRGRGLDVARRLALRHGGSLSVATSGTAGKAPVTVHASLEPTEASTPQTGEVPHLPMRGTILRASLAARAQAPTSAGRGRSDQLAMAR